MKAVLISIRPKWCELIANGKKTIEVRKTRPKIETPFKCYIYCTVGKGNTGDIIPKSGIVCGKVIGEFVCDGFDEFTPTENGVSFKGLTAFHRTCLSLAGIREYLNGKIGYGWRISDLKIYDKPRELSEFIKPCIYGEDSDVSCFLCEKSGYSDDMYINCFNTVTRSPQSWCYVEEVC